MKIDLFVNFEGFTSRGLLPNAGRQAGCSGTSLLQMDDDDRHDLETIDRIEEDTIFNFVPNHEVPERSGVGTRVLKILNTNPLPCDLVRKSASDVNEYKRAMRHEGSWERCTRNMRLKLRSRTARWRSSADRHFTPELGTLRRDAGVPPYLEVKQPLIIARKVLWMRRPFEFEIEYKFAFWKLPSKSSTARSISALQKQQTTGIVTL